MHYVSLQCAIKMAFTIVLEVHIRYFYNCTDILPISHHSVFFKWIVFNQTFASESSNIPRARLIYGETADIYVVFTGYNTTTY